MIQYHTLPAGTKLFHGTATLEDFAVPRGPAWFCLDRESAAKWAGWRSPYDGRHRVLLCTIPKDIRLVNVVALAQWEEMCERVTGEPDPIIFHAAMGIVTTGEHGWFGGTEIMIADTTSLEPQHTEFLA